MYDHSPNEFLFYGAIIGHVITRPSCRPHYTSCPSVCPSVRPSIRLLVRPVRARNSKTKKRRKIEIGTNVPQDTSKQVPIFS